MRLIQSIGTLSFIISSQEDNPDDRAPQNAGLFSGIFTKLFTGSKKDNEISVTAIATNGKTIILGYSNGTCAVYDLAQK